MLVKVKGNRGERRIEKGRRAGRRQKALRQAQDRQEGEGKREGQKLIYRRVHPSTRYACSGQAGVAG